MSFDKMVIILTYFVHFDMGCLLNIEDIYLACINCYAKTFLETFWFLTHSWPLYPLFAGSREKKSPAMPGSPVDAKTHSRSAPSSSASSTMPPLPSVNPSGPRPASFSTTACKGHSWILFLSRVSLLPSTAGLLCYISSRFHLNSSPLLYF